MRALFLSMIVVACSVGLGVAAGCASSKPVRYYVLSSIEQSPADISATRVQLTIGVSPVRIPAYLDRQQMVSRTSDNSVKLAQFDRWAEPLKDSVQRVVAANLAALLPGDRVVLYPSSASDSLDCLVRIDVRRFDGVPGGNATLDAQWTVEGLSEGRINIKHRAALAVEGGSYDALAKTQSRLLEDLSKAIAAEVRSGPVPAGR